VAPPQLLAPQRAQLEPALLGSSINPVACFYNKANFFSKAFFDRFEIFEGVIRQCKVDVP
jgi:hypothetical protein